MAPLEITFLGECLVSLFDQFFVKLFLHCYVINKILRYYQ